MGVTNNFYLLSKSPVRKNDIERIEKNIEKISKEIYQKIIEENDDVDILDIWTLDEIKNSLKIEFKENNWFIGDEDFFFYEDENGKIEIGKFAKEELEYNAVCPICDFFLYEKVFRLIIENYKNRTNNIQINFPFNENKEGIQCSSCGLIIEKEKLTGRKIIGKFRIYLPHLIFEYFTWEEIVEYFKSHEKNEFYIEHYQYP